MAVTKRPPPEDIEQQLRLDENDVPYVYQDSRGFWTLGVGFLVDRRKRGRMPPEVRDFWLRLLLSRNRDALRKALPWFDQLDPVRQGVLENMAYQMGVIGLLAFKATLAAVQAGRYADAAKAMRDSLWFTQTPNRADRLADQMELGAWQ